MEAGAKGMNEIVKRGFLSSSSSNSRRRCSSNKNKIRTSTRKFQYFHPKLCRKAREIEEESGDSGSLKQLKENVKIFQSIISCELCN